MTFTERARRAQLTDAAIAGIAEHGVARCSLARVAEVAGLSKAAVLYHFPGKDALVRSAYDHVLDALTGAVGQAVDDAPGPADAVDAYVTTMIDHLARRPRHVRVLAEALGESTSGVGEERSARWGPLAGLVDAAREAGDYRSDVDSRRLAVVIGGAIDGILTERLDDPGFDTGAAAAELCDLLARACRADAAPRRPTA